MSYGAWGSRGSLPDVAEANLDETRCIGGGVPGVLERGNCLAKLPPEACEP